MKITLCRIDPRFQVGAHENFHTVVIATEKLSNSEAKPRCYENFEGDENRMVIFHQHLLRICLFLVTKFIKLFPSIDYEFTTTLLSPLFT